MAQLHIKIDYATSEAEVLGVKTFLKKNSKSHYVLDLLECEQSRHQPYVDKTAHDVFLLSTSRELSEKELMR